MLVTGNRRSGTPSDITLILLQKLKLVGQNLFWCCCGTPQALNLSHNLLNSTRKQIAPSSGCLLVVYVSLNLYRPYSQHRRLCFLMGVKVRLWDWGIDVVYLFHGLCYLKCFWIVLLTKHSKNTFPRNVSRQKTQDNITSNLGVLFSRYHWKHCISLSLTVSPYLSWCW